MAVALAAVAIIVVRTKIVVRGTNGMIIIGTAAAIVVAERIGIIGIVDLVHQNVETTTVAGIIAAAAVIEMVTAFVGVTVTVTIRVGTLKMNAIAGTETTIPTVQEAVKKRINLESEAGAKVDIEIHLRRAIDLNDLIASHQRNRTALSRYLVVLARKLLNAMMRPPQTHSTTM